MADSPWYVGMTHRPLSRTFLDDSGVPVPITGALGLRISINGAASFLGTGAFVLTDAPNGVFTYQFSASDVAVAGVYKLQFFQTYGDGTVDDADPISILVNPTT